MCVYPLWILSHSFFMYTSRYRLSSDCWNPPRGNSLYRILSHKFSWSQGKDLPHKAVTVFSVTMNECSFSCSSFILYCYIMSMKVNVCGTSLQCYWSSAQPRVPQQFEMSSYWYSLSHLKLNDLSSIHPSIPVSQFPSPLDKESYVAVESILGCFFQLLRRPHWVVFAQCLWVLL